MANISTSAEIIFHSVAWLSTSFAFFDLSKFQKGFSAFLASAPSMMMGESHTISNGFKLKSTHSHMMRHVHTYAVAFATNGRHIEQTTNRIVRATVTDLQHTHKLKERHSLTALCVDAYATASKQAEKQQIVFTRLK